MEGARSEQVVIVPTTNYSLFESEGDFSSRLSLRGRRTLLVVEQAEHSLLRPKAPRRRGVPSEMVDWRGRMIPKRSSWPPARRSLSGPFF